MKPEAVDEVRFLERAARNNENREIFYKIPETGGMEIPLFFSAERKDLSFILLIDLKKNQYYKTIEYQVVSDRRGNGHIVILYDREDRKDIYYSPGLSVSMDDYSDFDDVRFLGSAQIEGYFSFGKDGLTASMSMEDRSGRAISYRIAEQREPAVPGGLIAPVSGDIENPDSLPLVYMDGFDFSPKKGTVYSVRINGEEQSVQSIPFKLNGYRPLMIRYSRSSPVINWNREFEGSLFRAEVHRDYRSLEYRGWKINLSWEGDIPEIDSMVSSGPAGDLTLRFSPPLPNLLYLDEPESLEGRFSFSTAEHSGIFAGEYHLEKNSRGDWIFTIDPTHSSKPPILPGSWWKKFRYRAQINPDSNRIKSEWLKEL